MSGGSSQMVGAVRRARGGRRPCVVIADGAGQVGSLHQFVQALLSDSDRLWWLGEGGPEDRLLASYGIERLKTEKVDACGGCAALPGPPHLRVRSPLALATWAAAHCAVSRQEYSWLVKASPTAIHSAYSERLPIAALLGAALLDAGAHAHDLAERVMALRSCSSGCRFLAPGPGEALVHDDKRTIPDDIIAAIGASESEPDVGGILAVSEWPEGRAAGVLLEGLRHLALATHTRIVIGASREQVSKWPPGWLVVLDNTEQAYGSPEASAAGCRRGWIASEYYAIRAASPEPDSSPLCDDNSEAER